jgi:PAS domain S-box-containing protein
MAAPSQEEILARLEAYQDRLAEAERKGVARFNEAFDDPPEGVCVHEFDSQGIIRRVNREGLRILGYAAAEIVGRPVWELVVMQEASRESVRKKLAGEKDIKPFVRTFRKGDGAGIAMLLYDRRLYDANGRPVGIRTAMSPVPSET